MNAPRRLGGRMGDLTEGPIMRTLLMFAVPTLLSNMLQSLNGTINSIWVGRLIGENALAATANANIVIFLMSSAAFGFGMAGTVLIGQRFGARDVEGARKVMGTAIGFCFALILVISAIGWIYTPQLLSLMSTPPEAFPLARDYLKIVFLSMPLVMVSIILSMGLRGAGDARTPLIFMGVSVAVDIILNPLLISGIGPFPELGIRGSAISMMIAAMVSFVGAVIYTYAKDLPLRLRGHELGFLIPQKEELKFILSKGFPMGAQMLIMSAAGIIVVGLVNREGVLMTAAYGAAMQVFTYIQMPAMAIGGAVSAMAAQYIGAKKWHRLDELTKAGVIVNAALTGFLTVLILIFDKPVLGLFLGPDSPAVPVARHIQFLVAWNFIFFGMTMVMTGTMRAAGAVWIPLGILAFTLYPVRLGFYYLGYPYLGSDAIWWSFPVAALASLTIAAIVYYKSNWREAALVETSEEAAEQANADGEPAGRVSPTV